MAVLDKIKNMFPGRGARAGAAVAQGGSSLNKKTIVVGGVLILSVVAMVVMFTIESELSRKHKLYSNIAAEQQVISQQIAVNALEAAAGQQAAFDGLARNQSRFLASRAQ